MNELERLKIVIEKLKAFIASQAKDIKLLQTEYKALLGERKALKDLAMARDAEVDRLKAALMEIAIDNECDCDDGTCQKCICRNALEAKG
jgi:hypothetical protein